ncbi:unnamed protein product [Paramecium octaurelia]|uniref:Uncharacterized protein n=1 Tax=Paramecium octaurelia TaxID=43137 RepID=A0A8S1T447_PAROT|nr:unnamed protein product [Paramecium octaurelia]
MIQSGWDLDKIYDIKGRQGFYSYYWQFEKTTFQIKFTSNSELIYYQFGNVLRIEKIIDQKNKPIIMTNLEQIKHLKWEGNYGINNTQTGKWIAFWKGKQLDVGGYYDENGSKIGKWIELFENYWDFSPVTYVGEYQVGNKQGRWDTFYDKQKIGGGSYQNGNKVGLWTDLYENYYCYSYRRVLGQLQNWQMGYNVLNQNHVQNIIQKFIKYSGSTDYDQNGLKNGIGIELNEDFYYCCQVIYRGEYKNNIKVGRWDTIFLENNTIIGGGNYDINGLKEGLWVDLHDGFNIYYKHIQTGTYQNGIRQGQFIESQLS